MACDMLTEAGTEEALELLVPFLRSEDLFRRRYVLSVIFKLPGSNKYANEVSRALRSEVKFLITTALNVAYEFSIPVNDEQTLEIFRKHGEWIDIYSYNTLHRLKNTEKNYNSLVQLYNSKKYNDSQKNAIAEVLAERTDVHFDEIYQMLSVSKFDSTRHLAVKMAEKAKRSDLVILFKNDKNGHIRKLVERYFNE